LTLTRMQAFVVGKDFGAMPAYAFTLWHPDRTCGMVCLGAPFNPVPTSFNTMTKMSLLTEGLISIHTTML
jgi:pimeloyl-ACP methyl ester carboxylesterase